MVASSFIGHRSYSALAQSKYLCHRQLHAQEREEDQSTSSQILYHAMVINDPPRDRDGGWATNQSGVEVRT
jgi:hypothetical protein